MLSQSELCEFGPSIGQDNFFFVGYLHVPVLVHQKYNNKYITGARVQFKIKPAWISNYIHYKMWDGISLLIHS